MKDKTGGVNGINSNTLKTISTYISLPLEYIFNLCIANSKWPRVLKTAKVVPIFKAGDRSCASNYRPISLISRQEMGVCKDHICQANLFLFIYLFIIQSNV